MSRDFYKLNFKTSRGETVSLDKYSNNLLLIVNTATKCGFAPQFKELEKLHKKYKDKGLVVIGFPSNQFANQEPETNENMVQACKQNFGVTFLLTEKIDVNGKKTHPVFKYLKENSKSGFLGNKIKWNFTKFLVSADGKKILRFPPNKSPMELEVDILGFLNLQK